jgi:hypothetical protein
MVRKRRSLAGGSAGKHQLVMGEKELVASSQGGTIQLQHH